MSEKKVNTTKITTGLPFSDDLLQFINIENWDGKIIKLNKEFYQKYIHNEMSLEGDEREIELLKDGIEARLAGSGIYILLGEENAYIGQTNNFKRNMTRYFGSDAREADKGEICQDIIFFSKSEGDLHEGLRKNIESMLIQEARDAHTYDLLNDIQNTSESLNIGDYRSALSFKRNVEIILNQLGITLLKRSPPQEVVEDIKDVFICTAANTNAKMVLVGEDFVVKKNSLISKTFGSLNRYLSIRGLRERLERGNVLRDNDENTYILNEDIRLPSASAAATFVTGRSISGNLAWVLGRDPNVNLGAYREHGQQGINEE